MKETWTPPGHGATPPLPPELYEGACGSARKERDLFWPPDSDKKRASLKALQASVFAWEGYCSSCPVLEKCYTYSIEHEEYGIWAGTIDFDRRAARVSDELREYGRNRLLAGYQPFPPARCNIEDCKRVVRHKRAICSYHQGALTKQSVKKGKKK